MTKQTRKQIEAVNFAKRLMQGSPKPKASEREYWDRIFDALLRRLEEALAREESNGR